MTSPAPPPPSKGFFSGLRPNVVWLGFASFFTDLASEMVFPLMPMFLTVVIGAGKSSLGMIEGAADSLAALLRIISGWASDRVGKRKPFIFWGYFVSAATRPFLFLATTAAHVGAIRFVDRFGKGTRLAARDALIADSCDPGARGKAFGLQNAMDNFGAALGPLIATWMLLRGVPLRTIFLWTAIPAGLVMVVIAFCVRDVPSTHAPAKLSLSLRGFDGRFKWALATITLFTLANSSDIFLVQRMMDIGIPMAWIPVAWAGFSVWKSLLATHGGWFSDRFGRNFAMCAGWGIYAVAYVGFAFAGSGVAFLGCLAVYAVFNALATSVQRAVVADLAPKELRGTAYGLYYFAIGIASFPASAGFGWVFQHYGARPAFLMDAGIAVAACGMLLLGLRRSRQG